jgi:CheY-like chemotaxis protein
MKQVLVIEDNRDNLLLLTMTLEQAGYTVIAAESGEEGVEAAIRERPDFILLDINLPGIDGLETARRIRSSKADGNIPIIAVTSHAMLGDREKIMAAGCNGYFEKPIDPLTFVDRIHELLGAMP